MDGAQSRSEAKTTRSRRIAPERGDLMDEAGIGFLERE
jgi:hypothetical protein